MTKHLPDCLVTLTRAGIDLEDAWALRRIAMQLHRWHELECGVDNGGVERVENARWEVKAKARFEDRNESPNKKPDSWLTKIRYCYAPDKDSAIDKAEKDLRRAGYSILASVATMLKPDDGKGKTFWYNATTGNRYPTPDRETPALKRLAKIMGRYPTMQAYVQGDPRGAALYILRLGDVPEGANVDSYYSRGIAVYR